MDFIKHCCQDFDNFKHIHAYIYILIIFTEYWAIDKQTVYLINQILMDFILLSLFQIVDNFKNEILQFFLGVFPPNQLAMYMCYL